MFKCLAISLFARTKTKEEVGVGLHIKDLVKYKARHNLKGYFRYKTITSQNVSSEAQVKDFFIS